MKTRHVWRAVPLAIRLGVVVLGASWSWHAAAQSPVSPARRLGSEQAVPHHLTRAEEAAMPVPRLVDFGRTLFSAVWTDQDGAGRPLSKGTGEPLTDRTRPLSGREAINRVSGPDANACGGCHNLPNGFAGGGGDFVTNVFVGAERFDYATFDRTDRQKTRGSLDEAGHPVTLQTIGNSRATTGLSGAGYIEMLAREMTRDLQSQRDSLKAGREMPLVSKGVEFGVLRRKANGGWDTSGVQGLPAQSLRGEAGSGRPGLVIRPWRQSGSVVSLRDFVSDAFNQHLGIQTTERFGAGTDPDGDGVPNEMTSGDVTAVALFMATLPVPGRVIPTDPERERLVVRGERIFSEIGCGGCHRPSLPLTKEAWGYAEPGPYADTGAVRRNPRVTVDLGEPSLPLPRLSPRADRPDVVDVPAFTDLKLHDITDPAADDGAEPLDINEPRWSSAYRKGNRQFVTRRLWGAASEPPFFHHGLFTTLQEAVVAHSGEALETRKAFQKLPRIDQDSVIAFLNSLQVLPQGSRYLVVDERYQPRIWPPRPGSAR